MSDDLREALRKAIHAVYVDHGQTWIGPDDAEAILAKMTEHKLAALAQTPADADAVEDAARIEYAWAFQTPAYPMPALMPRLDYAHHGFQQGGYLSDTGPCVWRADGYSPYCGIARTEHDEVLTRRRGGTWRWPLVPTREE